LTIARPIVFAIPGDIRLPTGGYAYDRRVLAEWRASGVAADHLALPGSFPDPSDGDMAETGHRLLASDWNAVLLIDGLAYGTFPESAAAGLAGRVVALCHHPLGFEAGLTVRRAAELVAREAAALRYAAHVVTTSNATKRLLAAEFAVPPERITVAEPGTDPAPRAIPSGAGLPTRLLAVGSVVPRKGYDVLVAALATLRDLAWELDIVGAIDRSPETTLALRRQIFEAGFEGRIRLRSALSDDEVASAYAACDIFVQPSLFEGYGMALTEAWARGLPIVCTTGGAAAETVPDDVALKVKPGDAGELSQALAGLIGDRSARLNRAGRAWATCRDLPRWSETARIIATVCSKVSHS
jgi:glycosyltransferase involved in cell wall biosynthesis